MTSKPRYNAEGVKLASAATSEYFRQIYRLQEEHQLLASRVAELQSRMATTVEQLTLSVLPDAAESTVAHAAEALQLDALRVHFDQWTQNRQAWEQEKSGLLADAYVQQQEGLIGEGTGEWCRELKTLEDLKDGLMGSLLPYRQRAFQQIYARKDKHPPSGLRRVLLALTGVLKHRRKREAAFLKQMGLPDLRQAFGEFERLDLELEQTLGDIAHTNEKLEGLRAKVARLEELELALKSFEPNRLAGLREVVQRFLQHSLTLKALRKLPANASRKLLFSQLILLREKAQYLTEIEDYLTSEEQERREHVRKVQRVQLMWEKNPHGNLRGDKRKWLVKLPEQKKQRTEKVLGWAKKVHEPVYRYEDEDGFDMALDAMEEVILFYLISDREEEPMPHSGFIHEIMPTIAAQQVEAANREEGEDDGDDAAMAAASVLAYDALTEEDTFSDPS